MMLQRETPPALELTHYDSRPHGVGDFIEVFRIDTIRVEATTANLTVWVESPTLESMRLQPVSNVTWNPTGDVAPGTTFEFAMAAYDFPRAIELREGDRVVWHGQFGSGAGTPLP